MRIINATKYNDLKCAEFPFNSALSNFFDAMQKINKFFNSFQIEINLDDNM